MKEKNMERSLYESENIVLTEINFEMDAEIDANYSFDLCYARHWHEEIVRPLSKSELKKLYEKIEKETDERGELIRLAVRNKDNLKLLGFLELKWISWNNSVGSIIIAIGDREASHDIENQIVSLACQYAFSELNLFRIEINPLSIESNLIIALENVGFTREVTISEEVFLFGEYHDIFMYGILRPEWELIKNVAANA
jgi:RimJ/RimL family protein N-acetyltransferase